MNKNKIILVIILVGAVGAGLWWGLRQDPLVAMVQIETREVVEVYVATGRLNAATVSEVGSELAGRIASVHVAHGDRPKAGQALVDLQPMDAKLSVQQAQARVAIAEQELSRTRIGATRARVDEARAAVASAETTLDQAKKELSRFSAMAKEGVQSPAAVERATTDMRRAESEVAGARARLAELNGQPRAEDIRVAQAQVNEAMANVEQTKAALGKTTINAPFDGLVIRVDAAPGENVSPGQTLVTIADTQGMEIFAEVDEDYFMRLAPGQSATLVFPAVADQRFKAVVTRVGPEVDPERGVVGLHLKPETLPAHVVPGLTVDVAVELKRLPEARAVPRSSVVYEDGKPFVFVVEDGVARRRSVTIAAEGDEDLAIEGFDPKIESIIRDASSVTEGDALHAKAPKKEAH